MRDTTRREKTYAQNRAQQTREGPTVHETTVGKNLKRHGMAIKMEARSQVGMINIISERIKRVIGWISYSR